MFTWMESSKFSIEMCMAVVIKTELGSGGKVATANMYGEDGCYLTKMILWHDETT